MKKKIATFLLCLALLMSQASAQSVSAINETPTPDTTTTWVDPITAQENEVIRLVNLQRAKAGLRPLTASTGLAKVAGIKAQDMATKNYFSHTSPTYGSPFTMMRTFGVRYTAAGENIAMGQTSAQAVMNSWMNSPGHRANILNPTFTQIGVGLAKNRSGRNYWVQQFIRP